MYKIVGSDQKVYGPISAAQVRQWLAEGRVNNATLLQAEGSNEWKPLSSAPEFGIPPVVSMPPAPARERENGMAVAGLIFGALSNVCCWPGVVCAFLGLTFSSIALSQADSLPPQRGKGLATAGLILSLVGLAWHCLPLFGILPGSWRVFHRHWRGW